MMRNEMLGGGTTSKFCEDFKSKIRANDVVEARIYRYKSDAALDGFFLEKKTPNKNELIEIDMPDWVVTYKDSSQVFLEGGLCGYHGEGPCGSYNILVNMLGVPEEIANKVYNARMVKYTKKKGEWKCSYVDIENNYYNHNEVHHIYNDHYVYLLDLYYTSIQDEYSKRNLAKEFSWFIPNVYSITLYPKLSANETGHFDVSYDRTYSIVVEDKSGNELWISAIINCEMDLRKQRLIMDIIDSFGLDIQKNNRNQSKYTIINYISNSNIKLDRPITIYR